MKLASVRLIAADVKKMVAFYERVTGVSAQWLSPVFAELVMPGATLAIGSAETVALWKEGSGEPGAIAPRTSNSRSRTSTRSGTA